MPPLRRLTAIASHLTQSPSPTTAPRTRLSSANLGSSLSTSASPEMSASVKEMVDEAIASNNVLIFSKTWCHVSDPNMALQERAMSLAAKGFWAERKQFCRRSKQILGELTKDLKVIELDETDVESQIQAYLRQLNGQSTVPHIYIRQQFIGGSSDLQKLPKQELQKRIAA